MKAKSTPTLPRCYKCSLDGENWWSTFAPSPGQAKQAYIRIMDGCADDAYLYILCRVSGAQTSEAFKENARNRGIPFSYVGMNVKVQGDKGVIAGHNSSANLDIYFVEGKHRGKTLNCHPNWKIAYFSKEWKLVKAFD